jgi:hypothetical protein
MPEWYSQAIVYLVVIALYETSGHAVKKLAVDKCDQDKPDAFEKVFEVGKICIAPA